MLTNNESHITACEMNAIRAERLKYNIQKQGVTCALIMQKDARNIDDFFSFDRILLDVPCSGSGTLNFENDLCFKYFSEELIKKSAKTQLTLLKKAIRLLKPGHEMVYSTCSILKMENEEIIKNVLSGGNVQIEPIDTQNFAEIPMLPTSLEGTMCVCPNELYEGFYVAKLRKI